MLRLQSLLLAPAMKICVENLFLINYKVFTMKIEEQMSQLKLAGMRHRYISLTETRYSGSKWAMSSGLKWARDSG